MQRKVVSRVDVTFYIFTLVNLMLLSQLSKKSVMLLCFLCDRLQLNLIIHTVCLFVMLPNQFVLYLFSTYGQFVLFYEQKQSAGNSRRQSTKWVESTTSSLCGRSFFHPLSDFSLSHQYKADAKSKSKYTLSSL